jgi:hypothetical protein
MTGRQSAELRAVLLAIRDLRDLAGKCVRCGGPRSKWNLCAHCARRRAR